jgi:ABC-type glycerol-3-phosphate transport system substrate-binding protein
MRFNIPRRQFLIGGSALLAGSLMGRYAFADDQKLVDVAGSAAPELEPKPTAEDLVGGPKWTPPDLTGTTLRLWGLNYAPHVERYKLLIKRFTDATHAAVTLEPQDQIWNTALTSLASGNPPDLFCLMGRMSDSLIKQGGLLDVSDAVYKDTGIDIAKWWFPEALQAYTWGGKYYGVPVEGNAHSGVSVRLDLVEAAGSKLDGLWPGAAAESDWPAKGVRFDSYDQLFQFGQALTQKDGDTVKTWGMNRQGWETLSIASLMWQQGVMWFDEESNKFAFDSDAGVQALEYLVTKPYAMKLESKLAVGNCVNAFVAGQSALSVGNDSAAGEGTKAGFKATNVVQPSIVAGQDPKFIGEGGWGFEIPVGAKNESAAIEFLKFMTTYEAQFTWSQIYGGMSPACQPLVKSEIYAGDSPLKVGQRRLLTSGANTRFMGHGWDPQIDQLISSIVDVMREGKTDAKQTAAELQKQVTDQQQRYLNS